MGKYFSSLTIVTFLLFTALVNAQDKDETKYYYIGKIGESLEVQMELSLEDAELRGSYYNDKTGIPLPLSGEVNTSDSKISLYTHSFYQPIGLRLERWNLQGLITVEVQ